MKNSGVWCQRTAQKRDSQNDFCCLKYKVRIQHSMLRSKKFNPSVVFLPVLSIENSQEDYMNFDLRPPEFAFPIVRNETYGWRHLTSRIKEGSFLNKTFQSDFGYFFMALFPERPKKGGVRLSTLKIGNFSAFLTVFAGYQPSQWTLSNEILCAISPASLPTILQITANSFDF